MPLRISLTTAGLAARPLPLLTAICLLAAAVWLASPLIAWAHPARPGGPRAALSRAAARFVAEDLPLALRRLGLLHEPPEAVALAALGALDAHDHTRLMSLIETGDRHAHDTVMVALAEWPHHAIRSQGGWGRVGPYRSEPWYVALPQGSARRIPITLTCGASQRTLVAELRLGDDGWRIAALSVR